MGSGVSRGLRINRRKVAIAADSDDESTPQLVKTPLQVVTRELSTRRSLTAECPNLNLPAREMRPLPINNPSPNFQNGNHVVRSSRTADTAITDANQFQLQQSPQSSTEIPRNRGLRAADTIGLDDIDGTQREMFEHTAMSLGMDWDDFVFNVLYFGDGAIPNMSAAINNAREETVALHSENNTPYKLRPASSAAINGLSSETLLNLDSILDPDCAVCKELLEVDSEVIFLPTCAHCFHKDCLVRWIKLQGFCPVCRAVIGIPPTSSTGKKSECTEITAISDSSLRSLRRNLAAEKISEEMISINSGHDGGYHDSSSRSSNEDEDEDEGAEDEKNESDDEDTDDVDGTDFKEQESRAKRSDGSIPLHRECSEIITPRHSVFFNSDGDPVQACGMKLQSGEFGRSFNSADRSTGTAYAFGSL